MEFPKLRRLLKTREYRTMYFQYIKAKIVNFVKKPIVCIKAIYNAFKFEKTSPSSWERYLRLKQIENEAKEVEEKSVTYVQFVGTISMFNISLISYCSYIERNDLSHEKFQKLHEEFDSFKEKATGYLNKLEEMDVPIPDELKELIKMTNFNSFKDLDEVNIFTDKIYSFCDMIRPN